MQRLVSPFADCSCNDKLLFHDLYVMIILSFSEWNISHTDGQAYIPHLLHYEIVHAKVDKYCVS